MNSFGFSRGILTSSILQDNGVRIWNEWADENGDLGPVYGKQWMQLATERDGSTVNQIARAVETIRQNNPDSQAHYR